MTYCVFPAHNSVVSGSFVILVVGRLGSRGGAHLHDPAAFVFQLSGLPGRHEPHEVAEEGVRVHALRVLAEKFGAFLKSSLKRKHS